MKVGFVISLLYHEPQVWAHSLLEQKSPVITPVDSFFEAMAQLYDDPQCVATTKAALHTLQQERCPVEDYNLAFRKWSADTGWNEAALRYQYRLGLSESLKDELARVETPPLHLRVSFNWLYSLIDACGNDSPNDPKPSDPNGCCLRFLLHQHQHMCLPLHQRLKSKIGLVHSALTSDKRLRLCLFCRGTGHSYVTAP